jgi:hypothetical protein
MKEIQLTQGQTAIVDDDVYDRLSQWKWCAHWKPNTKSFVAVRTDLSTGKPKTILLHREIMSTPDDMDCDHIFHNTLDNRRSQLRNVTKLQNRMNEKLHINSTSGYKGVSWNKKRGKWAVQIGRNKK